MAENKTYTGGCHCGEVRFEVTADRAASSPAIARSAKNAAHSGPLCQPSILGLRAGSDDLRDYQFGKKTIHHLFCPYCGVGAFSRGKKPGGGETIAVNVRCLDDIDIGRSSSRFFDGRSL